MSINSVPDIVKQGWGLEEEDLDKIMKIEKLKDVSQDFHDRIEILAEGFNLKSNIRITAFTLNFYEKSGANLFER